jgi:hypothetical protein
LKGKDSDAVLKIIPSFWFYFFLYALLDQETTPRTGGVAQEVECLLCKCKPPKKKRGTSKPGSLAPWPGVLVVFESFKELDSKI